jgi:hypothetical protein
VLLATIKDQVAKTRYLAGGYGAFAVSAAGVEAVKDYVLSRGLAQTAPYCGLRSQMIFFPGRSRPFWCKTRPVTWPSEFSANVI